MTETQRDLDRVAINRNHDAQAHLSKVTQRLREFLRSNSEALERFERSVVAFENYHASCMELISAMNTGTSATMMQSMYSEELLLERSAILEKILIDNNA